MKVKAHPTFKLEQIVNHFAGVYPCNHQVCSRWNCQVHGYFSGCMLHHSMTGHRLWSIRCTRCCIRQLPSAAWSVSDPQCLANWLLPSEATCTVPLPLSDQRLWSTRGALFFHYRIPPYHCCQKTMVLFQLIQCIRSDASNKLVAG